MWRRVKRCDDKGNGYFPGDADERLDSPNSDAYKAPKASTSHYRPFSVDVTLSTEITRNT